MIRGASLVGLTVAALVMAAPVVLAHPGGLNAQGCHRDRKNGGSHCHGAATPRTTAPSRQGGEPYYANCAAARAAGVAPLRRGDPGYRAKLDRDGDGIACE
ncbi:MAG: excalibur calcium-binding domain-containing protein [Gemmobacter sp.]|nr:excalibur calcium-binding domain-containing protein [Gemmobacter sp.]